MTAPAAIQWAALALLLIPLLGLGRPAVLGAARTLAAGRLRAAAVYLAPILPAAAALPWSRPAEAATRSGGLALYAALPLAALLAARRDAREVSPWDWLAVALFWIPLQTTGMRGWWSGQEAALAVPWMKITAACLVLVGFAAVRRLDGTGYRWRLAGTDIVSAAAAVALFVAAAIPLALFSGLAAWEPAPAPLSRILPVLAGILVFTALPEEIFFRGILFNLLQRRLRGRGGPWPALVISALAFAGAHAGPGGGGDPLYLLLVALAGVAYGWCFLRTGSLVSAVAAHTAVNAVHLFLFSPAGPAP